jgi:hypothetical protein
MNFQRCLDEMRSLLEAATPETAKGATASLQKRLRQNLGSLGQVGKYKPGGSKNSWMVVPWESGQLGFHTSVTTWNPLQYEWFMDGPVLYNASDEDRERLNQTLKKVHDQLSSRLKGNYGGIDVKTSASSNKKGHPLFVAGAKVQAEQLSDLLREAPAILDTWISTVKSSLHT